MVYNNLKRFWARELEKHSVYSQWISVDHHSDFSINLSKFLLARKKFCAAENNSLHFEDWSCMSMYCTNCRIKTVFFSSSCISCRAWSRICTLKMALECMWWVDVGWTPDAWQDAVSLPPLSWTGERKHNERLMGLDKDRERSLTNYHHGQNRFDSRKLI